MTGNKKFISIALLMAAMSPGTDLNAAEPSPALPYCVVDTMQRHVFGDRTPLTKAPQSGEAFYGQDGQRKSHPACYVLSNDGLTIYDKTTGLTWQRSPDTNGDGVLDRSDKLTLKQAQARPGELNAAKFGGYSDWRLPSIKELYSLIDFRGIDPSGMSGTDTTGLKPFIDAKFFKFAYGKSPERVIDSQYASSTLYVNKAWRGFGKLFGVNFADGRIKGYDLMMPGGFQQKTFFVQCVRGNPKYGTNDFQDNHDKTITDRATGLMWAQDDSGKGMDWQAALAWAQAKNKASYLGRSDWRVPSAKELQGIVDYTRSPDSSKSAAIDPLFHCSPITNEAGQTDYACYWTATTHGESKGRAAVYVAFGRAMGYMNAWHDVHGAGAQRSDPKSGDPSSFPHGRGPQGDAIRIFNFVRLVRNVDPSAVQSVDPDTTQLHDPRIMAGEGVPPPMAAGRREGPSMQVSGMEGPGRRRMGRFVPGYRLLPPYATVDMNFTPEQKQALAQLEKETKAKLDTILTAKQQKTVDEARPPLFAPGGGPGPQ